MRYVISIAMSASGLSTFVLADTTGKGIGNTHTHTYIYKQVHVTILLTKFLICISTLIPTHSTLSHTHTHTHTQVNFSRPSMSSTRIPALPTSHLVTSQHFSLEGLAPLLQTFRSHTLHPDPITSGVLLFLLPSPLSFFGAKALLCYIPFLHPYTHPTFVTNNTFYITQLFKFSLNTCPVNRHHFHYLHYHPICILY